MAIPIEYQSALESYKKSAGSELTNQLKALQGRLQAQGIAGSKISAIPQANLTSSFLNAIQGKQAEFEMAGAEKQYTQKQSDLARAFEEAMLNKQLSARQQESEADRRMRESMFNQEYNLKKDQFNQELSARPSIEQQIGLALLGAIGGGVGVGLGNKLFK